MPVRFRAIACAVALCLVAACNTALVTLTTKTSRYQVGDQTYLVRVYSQPGVDYKRVRMWNITGSRYAEIDSFKTALDTDLQTMAIPTEDGPKRTILTVMQQGTPLGEPTSHTANVVAGH